MSLLQRGNRKLPPNWGIFNLPEGQTCPGSTPWCAINCYARKASKMYKQVPKYRQNMLLEARSLDFVPKMVQTITKAPISAVRVHEAGDFYDQAYVNSWFRIATSLPDTKFFAYTKSFDLDFSARPANFIIRGSIDPTSTPDACAKAAGLDGVALCQDVPAPVAGYFTCPGRCRNGKKVVCQYCLTHGNVIFHKH